VEDETRLTDELATMPDDEDRFSIPLFIFQMIAAPAGGFLFGLIAVELCDQVSGTRDDQFVPCLCYMLVGFVQGYLTQAIFRRSDRSGGRFVWIPPVCLLAVLILGDRRGLGTAIGEALTWNPDSFDKGAGSMFVTMPALASCFYSIGTILAHQCWRGTKRVLLRPPRRAGR
jgi:hypothetical protein